MRDDISKLPLTAQAKGYARRGGLKAMLPGVGQKAFVKMTADLVNRGQTKGFKSRDDGRPTAESAAVRIVQRLIDSR